VSSPIEPTLVTTATKDSGENRADFIDREKINGTQSVDTNNQVSQ
jgi:hypothetical protein